MAVAANQGQAWAARCNRNPYLEASYQGWVPGLAIREAEAGPEAACLESHEPDQQPTEQSSDETHIIR